MGRIKTSLRCVTDITGPDPLSLVELGGGVIQKNEVFVTYERVTRSQLNLIFRRILCFKALILNSDQILGHLGKPEFLENVKNGVFLSYEWVIGS